MNQFEQELRKLFDHDALFKDSTFVGRTCYGKIGNDIRVRAEFTTLGYADHYEALKITMLNRKLRLILNSFPKLWTVTWKCFVSRYRKCPAA